jgi:hypothetical protein
MAKVDDGALPKEFLILFVCVAVVGFALAKDVLILEASPCLLLGVGAYYWLEHREEQHFMDSANQRKLRKQAKKEGWELSVDDQSPRARSSSSKKSSFSSKEKVEKKRTETPTKQRVGTTARRSKKSPYDLPAGKLFANSSPSKPTGIQKKKGERVYAGRTKTRSKKESGSENSSDKKKI